MGLIVRENTEPIADTETASANELELEYSKVFNVLNGNLDDSNFVSGANIVGAKIADGTMPGAAYTNLTLTLAEIASTTLTTANMSDTAAMQYHQSYLAATGSDSMTSSSTFVDVETIAEWNVTPASTSNFLFMEFTNDVSLVVGAPVYNYGFSVNGVNTSVLGSQVLITNTMRIIWAELAPVTTTMTVKPVYSLLSGSATNAVWGNRQFTAMLVPVK